MGGCNALNYGDNEIGISCTLIACSSPIPEPSGVDPRFNGYYLSPESETIPSSITAPTKDVLTTSELLTSRTIPTTRKPEFRLVAEDHYCSNHVYLNPSLDRGISSLDECAEVISTLKGIYGCSSTSGIFIYDTSYPEMCWCSKDSCSSRIMFAGTNVNIYQLIA